MVYHVLPGSPIGSPDPRYGPQVPVGGFHVVEIGVRGREIAGFTGEIVSPVGDWSDRRQGPKGTRDGHETPVKRARFTLIVGRKTAQAVGRPGPDRRPRRAGRR